MRAKALRLLCVALLMLLVGGSATVIWGEGRTEEAGVLWESWAVSPFRVSVGADVVGKPDMAFNPRTNEYLVVWTDERSGNRAVWGTVIDPDGQVAGYWPGPRPDDFSIGDERTADVRPAVACGSDGYFVVWGGEVYEDIWVTYGQRVWDSGGPRGDVSQVLSGHSAGWPAFRRVVYNSADNEYLVAEGGEERGARVSASGAMVSSVELPSIGQGRISDVCYGSIRNEYLVLYTETQGQYPDPVDFVEAQRLASTGTLLGGPTELETVPSRHDWLGSGFAAYNSSGDEYLVTWGSAVASVGYYYRGHLLTGDGTLSGGRIGIDGDGYAESFIPCGPVIYNPVADEYLVTWGEGTTWSGVRPAGARRIDSDGHLQGDVIPYSGDAVGYCPDGDRYLLCRAEDGNIYCRYLSGDGSTTGMERPIVGPGGIQSDAAISYHAGVDQYLTVWRDTRSDEGGDIYGQRIGADGILLGSNFALGDSYSACHPAVAYNTVDEEWLVVWQETSSSGGGWLRGQRVSGTGVLLGERFDADVAAYQSEASPALAHNGAANQYLVVWNHTYSGELHGRRIGADGSAVGDSAVIASTGASASHCDPAVAYNSVQNDYLVVWGDDSGVWAKRVLADGTVQQHVYGLGVGSFRPEVAYSPRADQYLVVATDAADGGPYVKMLRVAGDGGEVGSEVALWDYEYYSCDADVTYSPSADRYLGFCWTSIGQNRWELSVWEADSAGNVGGTGRVFGRTPLIAAGNVYHPGLACSSQEARCMLVWEECGDIWGSGQGLFSPTPTPTCTATSVAAPTPRPTETVTPTPTGTLAANLYLPLVLKGLP